MISHLKCCRAPAALTACLLTAFGLTGPARADVISPTPTLPLLGIPYESSTGAGCFNLALVCVTDGTLTLTSVVSSTFSSSEQDIVADATYMATLTNLTNTPIGSVTLTGTVDQKVVGRLTATATGSWTTDIVSMSLSGPVLGETLTLTQDTTNASSGTTSIVPFGNQGYIINSFFDVYADLSLDSTLSTVVGPIALTATPAPEPASLAILALPVALLVSAARSGRRAVTAGGHG